MTLRNDFIAKEFASGSIKGQSKTMFIEGDVVYSYGYHFPIAKRVLTDKGMFYLFTKRGYSNSTSKHKAYVGYEIGDAIHLDKDLDERFVPKQRYLNEDEVEQLKERDAETKRTNQQRETKKKFLKEQNQLIAEFLKTRKGKKILRTAMAEEI